MPKKNIENRDKEFAKMSVDDLHKFFASATADDMKSYYAYLGRLVHEGRKKDAGARRRKAVSNRRLKEINKNWNEKIVKKDNEIIEEHNDETLVKKPTQDAVVKKIDTFKRDYKIDVLEIARSLENAVSSQYSDIKITKYQKNNKRKEEFIISDVNKEEFYKIYKNNYKSQVLRIYNSLTTKGMIQWDSKSIGDLFERFDEIVTRVIFLDKKIMVPSFGGMDPKEYKNFISKNIVKYYDDSKFDKYLTSNNKFIKNLGKDEIKNVLAESHKNLAEVLKNSVSFNENTNGEIALKSIQKAYLTISRIHSSHGFFYKLFNSKLVKEEQKYLDTIKNVCIKNFKIDGKDLTEDTFLDNIYNNEIDNKKYIIITKDSPAKELFAKSFTGTNNIIKEESELEEDDTKVQIEVQLDKENEAPINDIEQNDLSKDRTSIK